MKQLRDRDTLMNNIVSMAADIMQIKLKETELIIEQLESKISQDEYTRATISRLRIFMNNTAAAIDLMNENEGCWS